MASIARRTVTQLLTEHEDRMGLQDQTDYVARAKWFLDTAHRWCSVGWHHYELNATDTAKTATAGASTVDVSSLSALVIVNVDLKDPSTDEYVSTLQYSEHKGVRASLKRVRSRPTRWTRWSDNLVFDCFSDEAYQLDIDYYKRIGNLDDTASNLDVGEEWDEAVLVRSLYLAHTAMGNHDLAKEKDDIFKDLVSMLPNPPLFQAGLAGEPVRSTGSGVEPHGGVQS